MNCIRHFSISHYFAELDYMHVRLTVFEDPIASVLADLQVWKLQSGGRKAVYKKSQGGLLILTDLADKVSAQRKAEAEKEKLKGF